MNIILIPVSLKRVTIRLDWDICIYTDIGIGIYIYIYVDMYMHQSKMPSKNGPQHRIIYVYIYEYIYMYDPVLRAVFRRHFRLGHS